MPASPHLRTETDPVSEALYFLVFRIPDDGRIQNTVILSVIHRRQILQIHELTYLTVIHTLKTLRNLLR
jgi:hypothetical protein